jgi:hypothetical protein
MGEIDSEIDNSKILLSRTGRMQKLQELGGSNQKVTTIIDSTGTIRINH